MNHKSKIPHYIHYCWFGGKPLPKQFKKYIATWERFFPGYEIIRWDESNFPISTFRYAQEAMNAGKMAFVSDVARIYALERLGGVYFDTDVEVIRAFDCILTGESAVLGTEDIGKTIGTGFMAFSPHHPICKKMLSYYETHSFAEQDITLSNTIILAAIIEEEYGLKPEGEIQRKRDLVIYPSQFFTAYDGEIGRHVITDETHCVHHFAASWVSLARRMKDKVKRFLYRMGKGQAAKGD